VILLILLTIATPYQDKAVSMRVSTRQHCKCLTRTFECLTRTFECSSWSIARISFKTRLSQCTESVYHGSIANVYQGHSDVHQGTPRECLLWGWLRLGGSLKSQVSFPKEPYKRDYTLQKTPIILRSLLIVATP